MKKQDNLNTQHINTKRLVIKNKILKPLLIIFSTLTVIVVLSLVIKFISIKIGVESPLG